MFNEDNTIEQMAISTLSKAGWKYVEADNLDRNYTDVMVESMVKDALIRLNPAIAEEPSRADEVIYKLRALIMSTDENNLITQNEAFKRFVFEQNSFPFGKDGRAISVSFFGTEQNWMLDKNEYVVTNQWVYPKKENGKRFDIVLLINGLPVAIGELKTPVRAAITWLDGAEDITSYEKSVPEMFATNIFVFATEGKCYRYGSIGMPVNMWGPWHTAENKNEGSLAEVQISMADMIQPYRVMDIFEFFTLFATDKKHRKYKIICRYQQYDKYRNNDNLYKIDKKHHDIIRKEICKVIYIISDTHNNLSVRSVVKILKRKFLQFIKNILSHIRNNTVPHLSHHTLLCISKPYIRRSQKNKTTHNIKKLSHTFFNNNIMYNISKQHRRQQCSTR